MIELISANIEGLTVSLWKDLAHRNIIGRSVYVLTIKGCEGGFYIEDLGDNKEKALNYYTNTLIDIINNE